MSLLWQMFSLFYHYDIHPVVRPMNSIEGLANIRVTIASKWGALTFRRNRIQRNIEHKKANHCQAYGLQFMFAIRLEIVRKIDSLFYVISYNICSIQFHLVRAIIFFPFSCNQRCMKIHFTRNWIRSDYNIPYNVRVIELSSRIHEHTLECAAAFRTP